MSVQLLPSEIYEMIELSWRQWGAGTHSPAAADSHLAAGCSRTFLWGCLHSQQRGLSLLRALRDR